MIWQYKHWILKMCEYVKHLNVIILPWVIVIHLKLFLLLLFLSFSGVSKCSHISLERGGNYILMDVRRHTISRCWFVSTTVSLFLLNWLTVCFKCISVSYFWVDSGIILQSVREQKDVTNAALHFAILQSCKRPCFYIMFSFPSQLFCPPCFTSLALESDLSPREAERERERVENVSRRFEKPIK